MKTSSNGNDFYRYLIGYLLGVWTTIIGGLYGLSVQSDTSYILRKDKWMCWISVYYQKMEDAECVVFKRKDIDLGGFGHRRRDNDFPKGSPILAE